jgi:hypothetical protein
VSLIDARGLLSIARKVSELTCTKSKGLPIDVLFHLLYFLHVQRRKQKARGYRSMSYFILYFLHAQRCVQKARGSRLTSCFILYFLYVQCYRFLIDIQCTFHTQKSSAYEKQGIYIYIHHPGTHQNHFHTSL